MAGRERDLEAVRGRVRQPVDAVRPEVVVLPLLAVGDDRRAGGLEPLDGVADRLVVERVERGFAPSVAATASISRKGLGMLPIGSVGICNIAVLPIYREPAGKTLHPLALKTSAANSGSAVHDLEHERDVLDGLAPHPTTPRAANLKNELDLVDVTSM